jgi:hypothetical protein
LSEKLPQELFSRLVMLIAPLMTDEDRKAIVYWGVYDRKALDHIKFDGNQLSFTVNLIWDLTERYPEHLVKLIAIIANHWIGSHAQAELLGLNEQVKVHLGLQDPTPTPPSNNNIISIGSGTSARVMSGKTGASGRHDKFKDDLNLPSANDLRVISRDLFAYKDVVLVLNNKNATLYTPLTPKLEIQDYVYLANLLDSLNVDWINIETISDDIRLGDTRKETITTYFEELPPQPETDDGDWYLRDRGDQILLSQTLIDNHLSYLSPVYTTILN